MNKFIFICFLTSLIIFLASNFTSKPSNFNPNNSKSFESGFDPSNFSRASFSLRFFKVLLIFLIFDIEIILILPIPLCLLMANLIFFMSSNLIIFLLGLSLIYEWKQGSLNWL